MKPRLALLPLAFAMVACAAEPPPAAVVVKAAAPAAAPVASFPGHVDDLGRLVPLKMAWVVEVPSPPVLEAGLPPELRATLPLAALGAAKHVADTLGLESDLVRDLFDSLDGAAIFGEGGSFGLVARARNAAPVNELLALPRFEKLPTDGFPGAGIVARPAGQASPRVVWYPSAGVVLVASTEKLALSIQNVATGEAPSFADSPLRLPPDATAFRAYGDAASIFRGVKEYEGFTDPGSFMRFDLATKGGFHSKIELAFLGARVPRLETVLNPHAPTLAARLPEETIAFVTFSLARKQGKTILDVTRELDRMAPIQKALDVLVHQYLGRDLAAIDETLGDELTFGVLANPKKKFTENSELDDGAVFALLATKSPDKAKELLAIVQKEMAHTPEFKVVAAPGSLRFVPKNPKAPTYRVDANGAVIALSLGAPLEVDRVGRSLGGKGTLDATKSFKESAAVLEKPLYGLSWVDTAKLLEMTSVPMGESAPAMSRIGLSPSKDGLFVTIQSEHETALLGAGARLAIYGVRRYLSNAKVAEARNTVAAMSRAAVSAYEREFVPPTSTQHRFCKSATPVPSKVPAGEKHQPSAAQGTDFRAGDDDTGWPCLRFEMVEPHYYQYEYRHGGPYKGPRRGGPDPGKDGFEVSAEGDLNGDGKTSLFTMTGKVDPKTHRVVISPIFVVDEHE